MRQRMTLGAAAVFLAIFMTACGAEPHETASSQNVGVFKTTINGKQAVIARGDEEVALTFKEVKTMENGAEYFFTGQRPTEVMEYDTYVDEEDRTYLYLKGTDVLAGIKDKLILGEGTPREKAVTADHACQKAQDYLVDYIGMDEFQDYTFKRCEYLTGGGYYTVLYAYEIDGIATTDTMDVFVRADGSVGGFSAFNRGAYRGLPDAEQRVAAAKAAQSPLKSSALAAATTGAATPTTQAPTTAPPTQTNPDGSPYTGPTTVAPTYATTPTYAPQPVIQQSIVRYQGRAYLVLVNIETYELLDKQDLGPLN